MEERERIRGVRGGEERGKRENVGVNGEMRRWDREKEIKNWISGVNVVNEVEMRGRGKERNEVKRRNK